MLNYWRAPLLAACVISAAGCGEMGNSARPDVEVKAGIFFGGQLQHRVKWPFVLDPARQTQGFRLEFRSPLTQAAHVVWEVSRPRMDHKRRVSVVTSSFGATIPAGSSQNDQLITLDESDRPGKWKLRVLLQDKQVFNDTIEVFSYVPTPGDD